MFKEWNFKEMFDMHNNIIYGEVQLIYKACEFDSNIHIISYLKTIY